MLGALIATIVFGFAVGLWGCKAEADSARAVQVEAHPLTAADPSGAFDQSRLCVFADNDEAKHCADGTIGFFRPNRWGNEQLPLAMAALYCDFRHSVLFNDGGVVCVFSSQRAPAPEAPRGAQSP